MDKETEMHVTLEKKKKKESQSHSFGNLSNRSPFMTLHQQILLVCLQVMRFFQSVENRPVENYKPNSARISFQFQQEL